MSAHAESNPISHVASVKSLLMVFAALVGLTVLTVWQGTQLELGSWNCWSCWRSPPPKRRW